MDKLNTDTNNEQSSLQGEAGRQGGEIEWERNFSDPARDRHNAEVKGKAIRAVVEKIFYSPATNGKSEQSINEGIEAVSKLISMSRPSSERAESEADLNDPFIKKHLAKIWEKTKQSQIELHIKPMFDSLSSASIKYFLEKGTVNGGFADALNSMMDGVRGWASTPPPDREESVNVAKVIVQKMGEYVNGLDRRNLGVPMMDEVAVMQMEEMVEQILENPSGDIEVPEYY